MGLANRPRSPVLCDIYACGTRELRVTVERCVLWSHGMTQRPHMDRDGCGALVCVRIILFEILIQNARARARERE